MPRATSASESQPAIELRERSTWEALDLGLVLARQRLGSLIAAWLLVTVPVVLLFVAVNRAYGFVALAVVWWFKPLYAHLAFHCMRQVFWRTTPSLRRAVRDVDWSMLRADLTFRRFSPWLYANLPNGRVDPHDDLVACTPVRNRGFAAAFSLVCLGFELALLAGGLVLWDLIAQGRLVRIVGAVAFIPEWSSSSVALLYCLASAVIVPFCVGGHLGVYVNERIVFDGWDISVRLRRRVLRTQPTHSLMCAGLAAPLAMVQEWSMSTPGPPPLEMLILERGWPAITGAFLFGFALLWTIAWRQGPTVGVERLRSAAWQLHLEAAGRLMWRAGRTELLLQSMRCTVLTHAALRWPDRTVPFVPDGIALLAKAAAIPVRRARHAMTAGGKLSEWQLVRVVADLERMNRALTQNASFSPSNGTTHSS